MIALPTIGIIVLIVVPTVFTPSTNVVPRTFTPSNTILAKAPIVEPTAFNALPTKLNPPTTKSLIPPSTFPTPLIAPTIVLPTILNANDIGFTNKYLPNRPIPFNPFLPSPNICPINEKGAFIADIIPPNTLPPIFFMNAKGLPIRNENGAIA